MESKVKRQIRGALICPMVSCWIIFSIQFIYIGVFHGILRKFLSLWDIIMDVVLLFSIEAIAVFITLSNNRNNYTFFKISFIVSIINVFLILFYIFLVVFAFYLGNNKNLSFFNDKKGNFPNLDNEKLTLNLLFILLICIKVIELLPLVILIVYMKKLESSVGTISLNKALQHALNPSAFEVTVGTRQFRIADKVMQIKNDYDKDVFNGDIGFITAINSEEHNISVNIDGREIHYDYTELDELVLAYAVSIHKSQGSEYPVVVIPIVMAHYIMLARNLIYTGITRGKKLVVLIGSKKALFLAVKNDKTVKRYTRLRERLCK